LTFKATGGLPADSFLGPFPGKMGISQEQDATIGEELFPECVRAPLFDLGGRRPDLEVPDPVHLGDALEPRFPTDS